MHSLIAKVIGTGSYLPEKRLTNADIAVMVDTTDEWIFSRTGIRERRIAAEGELTSDLALKASQKALEAAGISAEGLDLILLATTTGDLLYPSTATILQQKLGISHTKIPAFDLQAVCAGFMFALSTADAYIRSGMAKRVLVVGAETNSRIIDWRDRGTCILFGDGAGAVVLESSIREGEHPTGLISTHIHADGAHCDLLKTSGGVSVGAPEPETPQGSGLGVVQMRGNEVYKQAVKALGQIVDETLEANQLEKGSIDWLVPHQANIRIINSTAKRLNMSLDNVVLTVERHGNTSAASVPLALDEAVRDGRIKPGQLVLLEAFGAGFTWGSALIRW
ncbi:MAG: ketoacyl-ACP synthase III [Magnetococcales bacterium]|nr:ketoacyl-ACP synthase III [Magnetococcales bacterium]